MNLGQFRNAVSTEVGLDLTASTAASAEINLIDGYVNRAVVDLLRKTRCYIDVDPMVLAAGEGDYDISTNILEMLSLDLTPANGGIYPRPQRVSLEELLDRRRLMPLSSVPPQLYAFSGSNLISFYPTPSGADTATLYYVPRPTALSNTADDPSNTAFGGIPLEYHDAIEYYAYWRAYSYDDNPDSMNWYKIYQGRYREIRREVQRTGGTKQPKMRLRSRLGRHAQNLGFSPGVDYGSIR